MIPAKIIYIKLPEGFKNFDSKIPLPVEVPPETEKIDIENITEEQVVAGMLRVIADGTDGHIYYYRNCVLNLRPEIKRELGGAAVTKMKNGDFENARIIIDLLKALFPAAPEILLLNAVFLEEESESFLRSGRENEAAALEKRASLAYREALSSDSPVPDAFFNAAFFEMKRQDFAAARDYFKDYLEVGNDDEKLEKASEQIKIIETRALDDEHYRSAYKLITGGEEEKGMAELRGFIESNPDVWNAWFLLGLALRRLKRWEDGEAAFRKALESGGVAAECRNEAAICLIETGRLADAKRELESALSEDPENVKIISNLGMLHLKLGDRDSARAFFRAALEIEPGDILSREMLSRTE